MNGGGRQAKVDLDSFLSELASLSKVMKLEIYYSLLCMYGFDSLFSLLILSAIGIIAEDV